MGCDSFFFPIPLGVSRFLHIFGGSLSGKPLLAHQLSMAKSRVPINPLYTGGAGGYSFYVRGGEQVIRQRKNNSNYGEGASRSYRQMIRRIKWGNLVNNFKAYKSWQPKAYDSKLAGQTDYNIFMKLNIQRAVASLTKAMSEAGCGVVEAWQVSRGSLPPIATQHVLSGNQFVTDIKISNAIAGGTTVGQLSADIIANNPQFREGDNLGLALFYNYTNAGNNWPYVRSSYTEITLDSTSTQVVFSIPLLDNRVSKSTGGYLQFSYAVTDASNINHEVGFVAIHTRKSGGLLEVSSQDIVLNGQTLISQYSGQSWYDQCIATYGLSDEVPLDPSFPDGTITKVTANGAVVSNAETLFGSQVVKIYGNSLYGQGYRFVSDGVDLSPESSTDEYDQYTITTAGSYVIYVGGQIYMSFSVAAPSWPEEMSGRVRAELVNINSQIKAGSELETNDGSLEYPLSIDASYDKIWVYLYAAANETISQSDIQLEGNGEASYSWNTSGKYMHIRITPFEVDSPVTLKYKDYTFFVGNYSD